MTVPVHTSGVYSCDEEGFHSQMCAPRDAPVCRVRMECWSLSADGEDQQQPYNLEWFEETLQGAACEEVNGDIACALSAARVYCWPTEKESVKVFIFQHHFPQAPAGKS